VQAQGPQSTAHTSRPRRTVVSAVKMSSMRIIGELSIAEDLFLAGEVIGRIDMREHMLSITSTGRVEGDIFAKSVVVLGEVQGNIHASLRVAIGDGARVVGNLTSPRVSVGPGAYFHGAVDMQLGDEYWDRRRAAFGTSVRAVLRTNTSIGRGRG
jgi:cytoskeletal protein CcmA (bactofilin family)